MADRNWWFNRAGTVAPVSNPSSNIPNYGLTYDLATAPYGEPDEFDAIADALKAHAQASTPAAAFAGLSGTGSVTATPGETLWDKATDVAGAAWDLVNVDEPDAPKGVVTLPEGMTDATTLRAITSGQLDVDDIDGAEVSPLETNNLADAPVAKQIFWGLDKINEYASTAMVAGTLAEDDFGLIFKSSTWGDAQELTNERELNAGEAFMQMFYDKELILDEDRFEQVRQHNTAFNVGALTFNVMAAWKADPNVFIGKGVGKARDLGAGKLAQSGRAREVQRDILASPDMETAKARVESYDNLADRLRAMHGLSLYDRAQSLRSAAREMGFEEFKNLPSFRNSASGTTMAKLMQDVAGNDDDWNLVFRTALGDPDAVSELASKSGEISDKITAIEMKALPLVERDLERMEARYAKRLAEQGRPQDARIEITKFGDKWLDDEVQSLRLERDELDTKLATYSSYDSWINRALPGLDSDSGTVSNNAPNAIFGNLDRLGAPGEYKRAGLGSYGGKVAMWQHDDYSPVSWAVRAPTKPFLKRVGVVSLNDVDEGASALANYLDQLDHLRQRTRDRAAFDQMTEAVHQGARDNVLASWAGARTDMERKLVVERLEREAIAAVGIRHGLSTELMDRLGREIQSKRAASWGRVSDATMYSPKRGGAERRLEWVEDGNKVSVKVPVDPTQLANYHSLTNLVDIDRTIRENMDTLRSLDKNLASRRAAGKAWTTRHLAEFGDELGTTFNSLWKPLALLSVRWPMRVVADESMRVMAMVGVLPHLAQWRRGAGNALYNTGVVRPYEWWAGRKVKTGSLAEESLRGGTRNDFDAYDYRAITNPTGAVPLDALDLGKVDQGRYDRLNEMTARRNQYLRQLEVHRSNTREAKKVSGEMADAVAAFTEPDRPGWAKQWDVRLASLAEDSGARGFFFDPVTRKASSKGFAVSVYPGRLRTFDRKPSARELNYWTEKNSDLLAVPNNRVAVWLDKDTGRWHLDVVKTTKRREDAMLLASKAEATEFYDIEDGFTRYLSEDFYGHFDSPFVKPGPTAPATDLAADQAPIISAADDAGAAIGAGVEFPGAPARRAIGFGSRKWRSRDGRVIEGEDVFGPDVRNANIYHGVVSSRDAMQNLYGGYTRATGAHRLQRQGSDYRTFDPSDPAEVDAWAKAYAHYVNNHVRFSPFWQRMLDGQTDDDIYEWLTTTSSGRQARKRVPIRGEKPAQWVSDSREIFDYLFPNGRVLEAARNGELTPEQVLDLLPAAERMPVHGDTIKLALGQHFSEGLLRKTVDGLMNYLGSVPTDALVRHPYAATVYNREMQNYLASVPADKITNDVLGAAEAAARAKAVRQVRRTLYNIADDRQGVHMLRFVSPFFQAQLEVLERWGRISMEKPETIARLAQLLVGSQVLNTGLWEVQDAEGNKAKGYSPDNRVVFQVNDTMRSVMDKFPGLKGALDNAGDVTVPVSSLNLITGGAAGINAFVPSAGPIVTLPASEFYFKDRPELEDDAVYQWLYPFGQPRGGNVLTRSASAVMPAWMRRATTGASEDFDDPAFARRVSEIGAQQLLEWEMGGREGPRPTGAMAVEAAKNEYRLRAASSFFLPVPLTPRSPYQPWIDLYRSYQSKYGADADEKFYDQVGPDFYLFAQQATEAAGGMGPNLGEKKAYDKYKSLIERAPDLTGVLTGPFATPEFSDSVYQWQLNTKVSPTSDERLRERLSPEERISSAEIDRGWVEYGKLTSALEAEIRNRVAAGGSAYLTANTNADLAAAKDAKIKEIIERNPAWQDAYNSRSSETAGWLTQAYDVAFDHALDGRVDIEALRAYLIGRARLQDALNDRADAAYQLTGRRGSDQLSFDPLGNPIGDNADLAQAWLSWIDQVKAQNPLFAEIYNRYLEGDDLSTYISPENRGG